MEARKYPTSVQNLRDYVFVNDTKMTLEQFHQMLENYVEVVELRAKRVIETHGGRANALTINWKEDHEKSSLVLDRINDGVWGSRRQWAYGETVSRLLAHYSGVDLHPVFAIMLNPTGGIAGYGNTSILTGDMHISMIVHAVVHDGFGYVRSFHNKGPGYNYLSIDSAVTPTSIMSRFTKDKNSPFNCQLEGVWYTRREMLKLGTLGDKGRVARHKEMVARRQALARDQQDRQYPEHCLPTVADILKEYEKSRNVSFLGSVYGEMKQLILSVGSGMGYFREPKSLSTHSTHSRDRMPRRKRSAGAVTSQRRVCTKRSRFT